MNTTKGWIICVDDQPEVVDMLLMQLERAFSDECEIEIAESATEALHVLHELEERDEVIELIITDEIMPGLQGSKFLEIVHEHDPDIMTMMLTGQAGLDDVIYAVNHGQLAGCLKKPWNTDALYTMVTELLQQARTNRRNRRLAQEVVDEKNKAEAIVHSITDGILVIDSEDRISLVNAACVKILGIPEDQLLHKRILDVLEVKELILLHMEASRRLDEVVSEEIALPNPADLNTTLYIVAIAKTLRDKSGQPLGVVTVLRDVTREKEISAMKANFLATVSHELRTPLTSIVSTFELLSEETLGDLNKEQREFIETSREQGKVLSELIDNLLDLSNLESGEMELVPEKIDIGAVVREASTIARDSAQAKGLHFSIDVEPGLPRCTADKTKLTRLIKSLLSNAVKFTKKGGVTVKIASTLIQGDETTPDQPGILCSISDTGIGITKAHHTKIFEKFFQVDNSITREFRGSGLGLSICKAIVDAHHGKIWIESKLHKGSTFHIVLPVNQPLPNIREASPARTEQA